MNERQNNVRFRRMSLLNRRVCGMVLLFCFHAFARLLVAQEGEVAAEVQEQIPPQAGARVVMEHTEVHGKVVFVGDEQDSETLAVGVKIAVMEQDGGKVIHQTETDRNALFRLPPLDVGTYLMAVGKLYIKLEVVKASAAADGKGESPKILLVFMPRNLG